MAYHSACRRRWFTPMPPFRDVIETVTPNFTVYVSKSYALVLFWVKDGPTFKPTAFTKKNNNSRSREKVCHEKVLPLLVFFEKNIHHEPTLNILLEPHWHYCIMVVCLVSLSYPCTRILSFLVCAKRLNENYLQFLPKQYFIFSCLCVFKF